MAPCHIADADQQCQRCFCHESGCGGNECCKEVYKIYKEGTSSFIDRDIRMAESRL